MHTHLILYIILNHDKYTKKGLMDVFFPSLYSLIIFHYVILFGNKYILSACQILYFEYGRIEINFRWLCLSYNIQIHLYIPYVFLFSCYIRVGYIYLYKYATQYVQYRKKNIFIHYTHHNHVLFMDIRC